MNFNDYEIDLDEAIQTIHKKKWKKILIQLPEGLKTAAECIINIITKHTGAIPLIGADPCYGACDIPCGDYMNSLGVDAILHIGHTAISSLQTSTEIPILYINAQSQKPVIPVVKKALPFLAGKIIGLVTTAQHLHTLPDVQQYLQNKGFIPRIGTGDRRITHQGQVLGCNFSSAHVLSSLVDSYLFIGSGTFHPFGLILSTHKPVVAADPYTGIVKTTELDELKERVLRQRFGAITVAQQSNTFGIIIALKPGQQRIDLALQVQKKIQEKGKKVILFTADHLAPMIVQEFPFIDCFVSTLCPRIALDDYLQYKKNIITPIELSIALGEKPWENYSFDEI